MTCFSRFVSLQQQLAVSSQLQQSRQHKKLIQLQQVIAMTVKAIA